MFWFWLLWTIAWAAPPQPISATKYIKEETLFGDKYTIGYFEVEFDQPLFVLKGMEPCNVCNTPCPPCDPTDPDVCSGARAGDDPCPCYPNSCDPSFRTLGAGTSYDLNRSLSSGPKFYEYVRGPDPCMATVYHYQAMTTGSTWEALSGPTFFATVHGNQHLVFCPDQISTREIFSINWILDLPTPESVKARLEISQRPVSLPGSTTCVGPLGLTLTDIVDPFAHVCFPMNTRLNVSFGSEFPTFLRTVTPLKSGCTTFHVGFWFGWDMWVAFDNPWVTGLETNVSGVFFHDADDQEEFLMSVCFPPGEQHYVYMLIKMNPLKQPRNAVWIQDTLDWVASIPFSKMSHTAFPEDFRNGVTFKCGDKTFTNSHTNIQPNSLINGGILNTRFLYPSANLTYFYPAPRWLELDY